MKKQYTLKSFGFFKNKIVLYYDGVQIETETLWDDEADDRIEELEQQGYIRGYTKKEAEEARKHYEYLLNNVIEGE